jgi:transcriptional repressor NrdR
MRCPFCSFADTQVKDSRPAEDGVSIRRRRQCPACGGRFTTYERVQLRELRVIKRDRVREPFDRDKIMRSVRIALRKRDVSDEHIEHLVSGIVRRLEQTGDTEIASSTVGEFVMDALAETDPVAYVRYASVYRDFREAADFNRFVDEELGALKDKMALRGRDGEADGDGAAVPDGER